MADDLLKRMSMSRPSTLKISTRTSKPNVEIDGVAYHSTSDPEREARDFCALYPIEKADVIFQFGWGLGYAANPLLARIKRSARIIVFEPDEALFALAAPVADPRFEFVIGDQVRQFFDDWTPYGCQEIDNFLWLIWPAAQQRHPDLIDHLRETFTIRLRDQEASVLTQSENGGLYFEQVLGNFRYQTDPDVGFLFGQFKNVPLVVVSAGPSLDRNIRDLRGVEDRCFILAVDTALRPLLAEGITPHAVIVADPTESIAREITDCFPRQTYLIAEQGAHPFAFRAASRRFVFGLGLFPDSLAAKFGFGKSSLYARGAVATAALDLAIKIGANPIIIAGQPFDIDQKVARTENLIVYRDFCSRKMRQTPGVRFINATEGGILTDSAMILSLRDAIAQTCSEPIDINHRLRIAHDSAKSVGLAPDIRNLRAAIDHLQLVLETRDSSCGCLKGFLELAAKEALLKRDDHAVNESILWGRRICEKFYRTDAESRAAFAHRRHARAGVDV